jgi:hypothetical protein
MKKAHMAMAASLLVGVLGYARPASAGGYGTAGCGLGSILLGDKGGWYQIFAATTNDVVFFNQFFAITSGTSNCADGGPGLLSAQAFIETNRQALATDISRGQGETIASLSQLAGCADPTVVGARLQASFPVIFPNAGVSDSMVSQNIVEILRADPTLACSKLGS